MKKIRLCLIICSIALFISCISIPKEAVASDVSNNGEDENVLPAPNLSYKKPIPIAVLPFSNDTGDEDLNWLSNGISENLISDLSKSPKVFKLIDNDSIKKAIIEIQGFSTSDLADQTLEIGKLVAARLITRGSYQKRPGNVLKIICKFTDVQTGAIAKVVEKSGNQKDIDSLTYQISCELLSYIDLNANLKPPAVSKPKSRLNLKTALLSTIWPGLGDFPDRKGFGILMVAIQLGTIVGTVWFHSDYEDNLDEYYEICEKYSDVENFTTYSEYKAQRELMLSKHGDVVNSKKWRNVFFAFTIVHRIVGIAESAVFTPHTDVAEHNIISSIGDEGFTLTLQRRF